MALLTNHYARLAAMAAVVAFASAACTAKQYRLKIENIELQYQAAAEQAKAESAQMLAAQLQNNQRLTNEYQKSLDGLRGRYAAARVRVQNASRPAATIASSAASPDAAATSDGFSVGVGADETLNLLQQCDENTQKLLGLQAWAELISK